MAKMSADELSSKIDTLDIDDDTKISLMEDITDSVSDKESEELSKTRDELEKTKNDLTALQEKYKERFLNSSGNEEMKKDEDLVEKEVIDIREI